MKSDSKKIHVQYFALMREERGLSTESYETSASNAQQLFDELNQIHRFSLPSDRLRVSINDKFENWDHAINENDRIAFIPPVAGG